MPQERVLVIDDDPALRALLAGRLASRGYSVGVASDAITALVAARRLEPDVIVLDLGLPGGDGFLVMGRLRSLALTATIPIVVLSGRSQARYASRAVAAGAACYLEKPTGIEQLADAIRRACGEPSFADWC